MPGKFSRILFILTFSFMGLVQAASANELENKAKLVCGFLNRNPELTVKGYEYFFTQNFRNAVPFDYARGIISEAESHGCASIQKAPLNALGANYLITGHNGLWIWTYVSVEKPEGMDRYQISGLWLRLN